MSKACLAYEEEYGKIPKTAKTLIAFAKRTKGLKEPSTEEAQKAIDKATARAAKKAEAAKAAKAEKRSSKKGDKGEKKGGKGGKKGGKSSAEEEEKAAAAAAAAAAAEAKAQEEEEKKAAAAASNKPSDKFKVGDEVVLSKDRMGTVRYVGEIPELGDGFWYGIELTDGSIGQTDGAVKGKRYFQTDKKRALFVPITKIRRRLNKKDHSRKESMKALMTGVDDLRRARGQSVTTPQEDSKESATTSSAEPVAEEPEANGAPAAAETEEEPEPEPEPEPEAKEESPEEEEKDEESAEPYSSGDIAVKEISQAAGGNVLKFILSQSNEKVKRQFFKIYCDGQKHQVLVSAYGHVRELDYEQQIEAWAQILERLA